MENINFTIILTVVQVGILLFTAWFSLKRTVYQNTVDDSTAAINYRNIVVALQAEIKEARGEVKDLRTIMENSHLEIELVIEVGGEPSIKKWEWKKLEPTPSTI